MDHRRRLVVNIFSNWTRYAVAFTVVFLLNPFVISSLGKVQYGLWAWVGSSLTFLSLLDLGAQQATVRFVAARTRANDPEGVRAVFNVSQRFFAVLAAVIVVATVVIALLFYRFFPESRAAKGWDPMVSSLTVLLVGLNLAATMLFAPWNAVLFGKQRFEWSNGPTILALLLRAGLLLFFLSRGAGVLTLGFVMLLETFVRAGLQIWAVRRSFTEVHLDRQAGDLALLRKLATYSAYALLITAASKVTNHSPLVVLGLFGQPEDVTVYSQPLALYNNLGEVIWALAMVFVPFVSALEESGRLDQIRSLVPKGARYCLLVAAPILFFFLVFGREFLYAWQHWRPDSEDNRNAYLALALLSVGALLQVAAQVPQAALLGMARHRPLGLIYAVEAILNVTISVSLVRSYGILGVALGGAIPPILSNGILLPIISRNALGISPVRFFRESILPVAVSSIPAGIASYLFAKELIPIVGRATLLLAAAVVGSSFALSALFLGVPPEDRRAVFRWLLRRRDPA